MSTQITKRNIV